MTARAQLASQRIRWRHLSGSVPAAVRDLLDSIDVVGLRVEAAEEVEAEVFGWSTRVAIRDGRPVRVDPATAIATWRHAMNGSRQNVLTAVRRVVDEKKWEAHYKRLVEHEIATTLWPEHRNPEPIDGVLTVREPQWRGPSFGVRGYLEATPLEIPLHVVRRWQARTGRIAPKVWDLTAGGNTVSDVLTTLFAATVVQTDLAEGLREDVTMADIGDAGRLHAHGRRQSLGLEPLSTGIVVQRPDLVFIDPPSRGRPTHTEIYNGVRCPGVAPPPSTGADLAADDRDTYLVFILRAVRMSLRRLAAGGLVSVLLREAVRDHQRVTVDADLVSDLLQHGAELGMTVSERFRIEEPRPINQASLGTTRYPMTHMLFEKAA